MLILCLLHAASTSTIGGPCDVRKNVVGQEAIGSPYLMYVIGQEVRCNACYRLSLPYVGQEVRQNVCYRLSLPNVGQEVRQNVCYRLSLPNVGQEVRQNVCYRLSLLNVCHRSGGQM